MGYFDGAKKELHDKLKLIFENEEYKDEMADNTDGHEFQYTDDVTYNIRVEDDGEYKEYYVSDEDGNIIEIFTSEMADMDGRIPASIRQGIVTQHEQEHSDMPEEGDGDPDDSNEFDLDSSMIPDEVPEGDSIETPDSDSEELPENLDPVGQEDCDIDNDGDIDTSDDYLHNRRAEISSELNEEISVEDSPKLGSSKRKEYEDEEKEKADSRNMAGVYNEDDKE